MSEKLTPEYDKSEWGEGEWNDELDRYDFIYSGFSCFILRNHSGAWCGYVGVPREHPLYGVDNSKIEVNVHGGLTYSDKCNGYICHTPGEGYPDDVWWLGFDCAHWNDYAPGLGKYGLDGSYKNKDYAIAEVKSLAEQLYELGR